MRILVSGSHGFVGSALVEDLTRDGHEVSRLVRAEPSRGSGDVRWDPAAGTIDAAALEGYDAVVHLAGENLAGRWTRAKMRRIRDSRVAGTALLSGALADLERPPGVLVSASAMGYYGDRGDDLLHEDQPPGSSFLSEVVHDWEAATARAAEAGIRVVNTRFALVMHPAGGTLESMLPPFKLGLGGPLGSGKQYFAWVALDDVVAAIRFAVATEQLRGPVNVVAPDVVTNREFTKTLGRVLRRPTVMRIPKAPIRLAAGKLADELFASIQPLPDKLVDAGFEFRWPQLEPALRSMLQRSS